MGHVTMKLNRSFRENPICSSILAMINLNTKFEMFSFTHSEDKHVTPKLKKCYITLIKPLGLGSLSYARTCQEYGFSMNMNIIMNMKPHFVNGVPPCPGQPICHY